MRPEPLQVVGVRGEDVHLVGGHDLGPLRQVRAVLLQLRVDGVKVLHRVPALAAGHVNHMDQQAAAVHVPQEVVAQAGALAGALNDAGNVRHDEADAGLYPHHAQIGEQGGEVVVGDLGLGLGYHGEQRGLAHVGEAHQPHVRQQLQFQDDIMGLAGESRLGKAGHLPGGSGEVAVAPAAPTAFAEDIGLAARHVLHDLAGLCVPHQRAPWNLDDQICAVLAGLPGPLAVGAVASHVLALVAEVHQGGHIVIHLQNDGAAPAAVAAVRPAGSHIFFPVKGHGTVAAVPCPDRDSGLIDERSCHGCTSYCDLFKEFLILPILSENLPHVKSGGVLLKLLVYKNQKAEESVAPWGRLCYTGFAIKCSARRGLYDGGRDPAGHTGVCPVSPAMSADCLYTGTVSWEKEPKILF